jgi:uncharacterized OB-fold protein
MEWTELSGDGELFLISYMGFPMEHFAELNPPYAIGSVRMPEGAGITTIISGIDTNNMVEEVEKLPRKVKAVIREFKGQKSITFEVV